MLQTTNYSLNKPEATDVVDISKLNDNFDTIDTQMKSVSDKANYIQTAGGTATAITLSNVTLSNGFTVTFVAAYSNSGAATTINGKALYKAGTTSAPTLIAGKAYTVWYNGTNFFIKASAEGTATAGDVLAGKTFSSDTDTGLSGTMTDNGAVSQSLGINGTYTIPAGYHNGSGKVTQSITTKTAATYTPGTTDQTIAAGQYLSGAQTISGDADLVSGNIKSGVNIFGVAGSSAVVDTTEATNPIAAASVLSGKIGYVNGSKITGTIASKSAATYNPSTSAQTVAAGQYLSGAQTIAATTGTAAASDVLSGKTFNSANGIGLTGTISSKAAASYTPGTSDQTIAAGQYLSGAQTVKGDANLLANNIKSGTSIFGVSGTFLSNITGQSVVTGTAAENITANDMVIMKKDNISYSTSITKLSNPATLPTGNGFGCAFSPDGIHLAITMTASPYITIYKRNGDTFTKLADPATLPTGNSYGCSFSPDGIYLVVTTFVSPYIIIYKRSGDTFTKLANPATLPANYGLGCAFSPDGTYLAVSHSISPYITIYKRSGDTFTKLADPATLPTGEGRSCVFSPDGIYLVVTTFVSPYIIIYKRSGDTFTKLANPATLPTYYGEGCAFSPDGTYLAVSHYGSPYITIYSRTGDTFTKLTNPSTLPGGAGEGCAFSPDGTYLAVSHYGSPYITIYSRTGDTFTKLTNPSTLPTVDSYECAFSPDGTYLAVSHYGSPYITIYVPYYINRVYKYSSRYDISFNDLGYAPTVVNSGNTANFIRLPI